MQRLKPQILFSLLFNYSAGSCQRKLLFIGLLVFFSSTFVQHSCFQ